LKKSNGERGAHWLKKDRIIVTKSREKNTTYNCVKPVKLTTYVGKETEEHQLIPLIITQNILGKRQCKIKTKIG
jgi:hypothetical protein